MRSRLSSFLFLVLCTGLLFGDLVERERMRRQAVVKGAMERLEKGDRALKKGDYQRASSAFKKGYDELQPGLAYAKVRDSLGERLVSTTLYLTKEWERRGARAKALGEINEILGVLPGDLRLLNAYQQLNGYSLSPKERTVHQYLKKGSEYYNRAEFDKAVTEFNRVLTLDQYNKESQEWLTKCAVAKSAYYNTAYTEARTKHLSDVDQAWMTTPAPKQSSQRTKKYVNASNGGVAEITYKLKNIIIPLVDFEYVSVEEAVEFLRLQSQELDTTTQDPTEKGINFIIRGGSSSEGFTNELLSEDAFSDIPTTSNVGYISELKLKNVPLAQVLQFICDLAKLRYRVDDYAVTLLPLDVMDASELMTRSWSVAPTFISDLGGVSTPSRMNEDPFAPQSVRGGGLGTLDSAKEVLSRCGIEFKGDAIANYLPASSTLIVRNTINNLDLIDTLVQQINEREPRQIRILAKFVEISQEDTDELGFDWNLGIGGTGLALRGGSQGNGQLKNDFAIADGRVLTSGLRSGDGAMTRNSIDFILNNSSRYSQQTLTAPGILSVGGVFGNTELEVIMRGLAQKKVPIL